MWLGGYRLGVCLEVGSWRQRIIHSCTGHVDKKIKKKTKRLTSKACDSTSSDNHFGCCNEDCGDRAILFFNSKSQDSIQRLIHKYEQLVVFVILFKERVVYNSRRLWITSSAVRRTQSRDSKATFSVNWGSFNSILSLQVDGEGLGFQNEFENEHQSITIHYDFKIDCLWMSCNKCQQLLHPYIKTEAWSW